MQYTLKNVLSIPLLSSAKLLSGKNIISTQLVNSVSVMEIPVEDFVKKNELVLTTAIGCENNLDLFLSFIKDVFLSGAAAIAIAVGRHVHYIPQEIIDYCNENDFPLIELPWEIRFSDIIKIILEQINKWEQSSIQKADSIQRELLKLYLDNQPLDEVLQYLSKDLQMEIKLKYGTEFAFEKEDKQINDAIISLDKEEPSITRLKNGCFVQVVPIRLSDQDESFISFQSKKLSTSPIPFIVLNQITSILTLWLQKELTIINTKKKESEKFIKKLLNGDWDDKEEFIKQGKYLGYSLDVPYVCMVGCPEKLEDFYKEYKKEKFKTFEKDFQKNCTKLIKSAAKKMNKHVIHTFQRELTVIFLECTTSDVSDTVNCFLDILDSYVKDHKIPSMSWGIGENHAGKLSFHLSFKNARTALEIGRTHKKVGSRSTFASTGIYQLLISLSNNKCSTELMYSTIGALATYDKNNGLDLLHTLSAYIYHQRNVSQTARALSLHRQSLLYRLRKIECLTNRSLNDSDDIFLLEFCLKLWTVRFVNNEQLDMAK